MTHVHTCFKLDRLISSRSTGLLWLDRMVLRTNKLKQKKTQAPEANTTFQAEINHYKKKPFAIAIQLSLCLTTFLSFLGNRPNLSSGTNELT